MSRANPAAVALGRLGGQKGGKVRAAFERLEKNQFRYRKNVPAEKRGEFGYGDVWIRTAIDADSKLCV